MDSLRMTGQNTGMIFIIVMGAYVFGYFLAVTRIPFELADYMAGLELSPYVILAGVVLIYTILGIFLDGWAIMVLTIPIIHPMIVNLGFDPIWFGVMLVIMLEMTLLGSNVDQSDYPVFISSDSPFPTKHHAGLKNRPHVPWHKFIVPEIRYLALCLLSGIRIQDLLKDLGAYFFHTGLTLYNPTAMDIHVVFHSMEGFRFRVSALEFARITSRFTSFGHGQRMA